jgi:hypothetical protein
MKLETKVNEILTNNGLDFHIEKAPLMIKNSEGDLLLTPYYGLLNTKTNEVINSVKEGYTVSQNKEVVEMVLEGMSKFGNDLDVVKAGSINGGRRIFFQLRIKGETKIKHEEIIRYVTVIDSNDGSTGLSVGIGDTVMHCRNQFFKFYRGSNAKFRHTATLKAKIASIPELIELALNESLRQVRTYEKFMSTDISKNLAHRMVKEVLGYDKVITSIEEQAKLTNRSIKLMDGLYNAIETECNIVGNNIWGLFNGLTRFTTHEEKEYKKENGHMESMLMGRNYKKAIAGFQLLENEIA